MLPFYTGQIPTADDFNALATKAELAGPAGASLIGFSGTTVAAALAAVTAPPVTSVAGRIGAVILTIADISGAAAINGDVAQNFNVKDATGPQHAVSLSQADARYAPFGGGGGGGGVSSVGLSLPSELTVTGSPVTGAGVLTATWASQTAKTIFAAPTGASGTPVFRALASADLPTVAIAQGGTGQTTAQAAINALTQVAGATNEYVLTKDTATGNALWKVAPGGGSFIAAGAGAVTRTIQNKERDIVSVFDYGAVGAPTNDSAAFQAAVNALPAAGGKILVPDGAYVLNTEPNIGTKSVYWDIGPGCTFTGAGAAIGKFPYVSTVGAQKSVGPLIKSQSMVNVGDPNGGIAAFQIDMLQPSAYGAGNSLAMYLGAKSNNANPAGNTWALNTVINVGAACQGTHQCIEVDVDCYSATALVKGISISGLGTASPDVALEITRVPGSPWQRGIDILEATMGIQIRSSCSGGISINAPTQTLNTPIGARQQSLNGDTIVLQRLNDSSPGTYVRGVNVANTINLFTINGFGDSYFQKGTYDGLLTCNGDVATNRIYIANIAVVSPAGVMCIGNQTFPTAGGGIAKYVEVFVGSTPYKIPLYTW